MSLTRVGEGGEHALSAQMTTQDALAGRLSSVLRFDGRNFAMWKLRMRAHLQSLDLWDVVEREADAMAASSKTAKAAESDEARRRKAYSTLILALNDTHLQMVMQVAEGDAHGVWTELVEHFERSTMASKAHTRGMLHKTRMQRGEAFDVYRARIMELVSRLRAMQEVVSEGELIYVLLEGLPESYAQVKQSLEVNDSMAMPDIVKHLRDFEERSRYKLEGHKLEEEQEERAHYARSECKGCRCSSSAPPPSRCILCKQTGHWADTCKYKKGGPGDCHRCGSGDHLMGDCPERRGGGGAAAGRGTKERRSQEEMAALATAAGMTFGAGPDDDGWN